MRTETDLLAALDAIADESDGDVAPPTRAAGTHHHRSAVLLAVAAIVALGSGAVWAGTEFTSSSPSASGPGLGDEQTLPLRHTLFTFATSPRLDVGGFDLELGTQTWNVRVDGVRYTISLDTKASSEASGYSYPNTDPATATRVDINGVTGYLGCSGNSSDPPWCSPDNLTLAWQFDGESWAQIYGSNTPDDRARMIWLARAMDFSHSEPVRSPISVPDPPDGQHLTDFGLQTSKNGSFVAIASYTSGDGTPGSDSPEDVTMDVGPDVHSGGGWQPLSVDGHNAWWDPGAETTNPARFLLDIGDGLTVLVMNGPGTDRDLASFEHIAESVRIAPDLTDQSSWPVATQALP